MSISCPKCGKDDQMQSVSSIISSGTYTTTYQVPAQGEIAGHVIYGTVQQTGVGRTELATMLSAPSEKDWKELEKRWREKPAENFILTEYLAQHPSPGYKEKNTKLKFTFLTPGIFGFIIGLTLLCLSTGGYRSGGTIASIGIFVLVISLIFIGIGWIIYQTSNTKEYKQEFSDWTRNKSKFQLQIIPSLRRGAEANSRRLYYCSRDYMIFLPGTNFSCSASDLQSMAKWIELARAKS